MNRYTQNQIKSNWARGKGSRRRPGRPGNLRKRQHYEGWFNGRHHRGGAPRPLQVPADSGRCACGSGVAYRRCCKKQRGFRQRCLREFIGAACQRTAGGGIRTLCFLRSYRRHLARRGLELVVEPWIVFDLVELGHQVVGRLEVGSLADLEWRQSTGSTEERVGSSLPIGGQLDQALHALRSGDDAATLTELLGVWRQNRSVAVAELIDQVSARLVQEQSAGPARLGEEHWHRVARGEGGAVVGRLLATRWPLRLGAGLRRVEALRRFLPDPRIAEAYVCLLEAMPYTGETSMPFWQTVIHDCRSVGDPRVSARFEAAVSHVQKRQRRFAGVRPQASSSLCQAAGLTNDDQRQLARIEAEVRPGAPQSSSQLTHAEFLEAIYAAPGRDEPRLVYADWLQERGDPRGELIALQCARARGADSPDARVREEMLLRRHQLRWLGPLGAAVQLGDVSFERGFLAACTSQGSRETLSALVGDHRWSTVELIRVGPGYANNTEEICRLLRHPAMRALQAVHGVHADLVRGLKRRDEPIALRELFFSNRWTRFCSPTRDAFPKLTHVGLGHRAPRGHLAGAKMWSWLPELSVHCDGAYGLMDFAGWQRFLGHQAPRLRRIRFFTSNTVYRPRGVEALLTRGSDGTLSSLHVRWHGRTRSAVLTRLLDGLRGLEPNALTSLVIDPCKGFAFSGYHRRQLLETVASFGARLERLQLPFSTS